RARLLTLATKLGYGEFFEELARALHARFDAPFVAVAVVDSGEIARFRIVYESVRSAPDAPPAVSPGLFARACDSHGALIVTADSVDAARLPLPGGSMAIAPMGAAGRRFGALAIASLRPDAFQ